MDVGGQVGVEVLVYARRGRIERPFEIDGGVQRFKVHDDVGERVLGEVAVLGHDHRDRLPNVPHLVPGQRHLRADVEDAARYRRRLDQQRARLPVVAEVVGRVDRDDTRTLPRGGDVDRTKPRVRVIAPQERRVHHPRQLDVVHEQRAAREQSRVLVAAGRAYRDRSVMSEADAPNDVGVAGAPAEMSGEGFANLVVGRGRGVAQEGDHAHQDAGRAEAALQRVRLSERRLQGMERAVALGGEAFDCRHCAPSACTANIRQARTGSSSTSTVQAPQTPCSQPTCVPVSSR